MKARADYDGGTLSAGRRGRQRTRHLIGVFHAFLTPYIWSLALIQLDYYDVALLSDNIMNKEFNWKKFQFIIEIQTVLIANAIHVSLNDDAKEAHYIFLAL